MKIIKFLVIIGSFFSLSCHSNNIDWNDYQQSAIQINEPVLFLDHFGEFSQLNNNLKLGLIDYGNKNKKYSKDHILLMILIYDLKQTLSIADIKKLFTPMVKILSEEKSNFDLSNIYNEYLSLKKNQIDKEKEFLTSIVNDTTNLCEKETTKNYEDYKKILLIILTLLNSASLNKRIAEKMIDFNE